MFVRELPPDRGMLFLFEFPQEVAFWMKDTVLSLDLIFIDPAGRGPLNIAANARPYSLDPITSQGSGDRRSGGRRRHRPENSPQARRYDHPPVFANDRNPCLEAPEGQSGEVPCHADLRPAAPPYFRAFVVFRWPLVADNAREVELFAHPIPWSAARQGVPLDA
jgi:hypothetical protein